VALIHSEPLLSVDSNEHWQTALLVRLSEVGLGLLLMANSLSFIFMILYYGNKIIIIVLYYPQNISEKNSGFNRRA
jgi:hypothetical protein